MSISGAIASSGGGRYGHRGSIPVVMRRPPRDTGPSWSQGGGQRVGV